MKREEIDKYRETIAEEKMAEITDLYDSGEKITNIIKKYDLKISSSQMSYFLPKMETEYNCPYCQIPMLRKRTREKGWYYAPEIKCDKCGHVYNSGYKECDCLNCQKRKIQLQEEKKQIIYRNYSALIPEERVGFGDLGFEQQCWVYLLYCETDKYKDLNYLENNVITSNTILNVIDKLRSASLLYVSPDSPISAFQESDFPFKYYPSRVNYVIPVSFTEEEERMICNRTFYADEVSEEEVKSVLYELMYEDLLDEFEKLLAKRNISFEPTNKQLKDFRELLYELSYTQIRYLCYKVAVYYNDNITTGKIYKSKAPQQVLASVKTFYNNSMQNYGNVYRSDVEYVGGILRYFIENILKRDISILDEVI